MIHFIADGLETVLSASIKLLLLTNLPRGRVLGIRYILLRLVVILETNTFDSSNFIVVGVLLALDVKLFDAAAVLA